MKKVLVIIILTFLLSSLTAIETTYPFIYIPGMFDNGDLQTKDDLLVKNLNHENGFYYNNYFEGNFVYDKESIQCSSNIVGSKYKRLSVANLIGPYRTNISLWLMSDRLFCLMYGRAPKYKNYKRLTNYNGNDYSGICARAGKIIYFKGVIQELWAKYGKKVNYKTTNNENFITFENTPDFYTNPDGYFDNPDEIKFNLVAHSSGGVSLRRYIQLCEKENLFHHINMIINLSVPQKGARMMYKLKTAFPDLIKNALDEFYNNKNTGIVNITLKNGKKYSFEYSELIKRTRLDMMYGDSIVSKLMQNIIGAYILYFIPFDGYKRVLGNDPALRDLHPDHRFIKGLNKASIPKDIIIHTFKVKSAYAEMFVNIGKYLGLQKNDGVVDMRDTDLSHIPDGKELNITDHIVEKANHIPFPYIKPLFEMEDTISDNYLFLKILIKESTTKEEEIILIYAALQAIMTEFGLDLEYLLKNENYSVIDYFAEFPIVF